MWVSQRCRRTAVAARDGASLGARGPARSPHDIVGSDQSGEKLVEALKVQDDSDIDILGVFDDRNDSRALETCAGAQKLGKVDDIIEFARRTRVDLVLFALPISAETRILEMLKKLWVLPVDIRLSAHTNKLRFRPRAYSYLGKVPTLDVFEAPITDWDLVMKWLFDHIVGAIVLLLAAPVMALVALAVKLDSPARCCFARNGSVSTTSASTSSSSARSITIRPIRWPRRS